MQQHSFTPNYQQFMVMGAAIFVSVTVAVIVSTLVIMSLMRGEIASALSSNVQTGAPATAQATGAGCSVPAGEVNATTDSSAMVMPMGGSGAGVSMAAPLTGSVHFAKYVPLAGGVSHSFNNTSSTTMNTTNNVTNTETHVKTIVKDSFNDNSKFSHNTPVIVKDNTVNVNSNNNNNSGNTTNTTTTTTTNTTNNVASNNTTNTTTNTNTNTTTNTTNNVASNNVTNSNNTVETHLLSDNLVVVTP